MSFNNMFDGLNAVPFETTTTSTWPIWYHPEISPYTHTQKDVDEAYCKGYNEGLKVHEIDLSATYLEDDSNSISLACGVCHFCKHSTPYANYCAWCGRKILPIRQVESNDSEP